MNNLSNDSTANFASDWKHEQPTNSLYYSIACGVLFPITAIGVLALLTRL